MEMLYHSNKELVIHLNLLLNEQFRVNTIRRNRINRFLKCISLINTNNTTSHSSTCMTSS